MKLENTKSLQNVMDAFAGEAKAISKYSLYASIAREEGHIQVAEIFEKMMQNEREHAKIWYRLVHNGFNGTLENLETAARDENQEWKNMYPKFASDAREEGLEELASLFERVASIECAHERKFLETAFDISGGSKKYDLSGEPSPEEDYYCIFCGHSEKKPLPVCPVCGSADSFSK